MLFQGFWQFSLAAVRGKHGDAKHKVPHKVALCRVVCFKVRCFHFLQLANVMEQRACQQGRRVDIVVYRGNGQACFADFQRVGCQAACTCMVNAFCSRSAGKGLHVGRNVKKGMDQPVPGCRGCLPVRKLKQFPGAVCAIVRRSGPEIGCVQGRFLFLAENLYAVYAYLHGILVHVADTTDLGKAAFRKFLGGKLSLYRPALGREAACGIVQHEGPERLAVVFCLLLHVADAEDAVQGLIALGYVCNEHSFL